MIERFDEKFGKIQVYHKAYWQEPDQDGIQTAIPNSITNEAENIKSFIKSEIDLARAEERMTISMLYRNWKRRPEADDTDFDDVISKP